MNSAFRAKRRPPTVVLRPGLLVRQDAVGIMWALEQRGVRFSTTDDGRVNISDGSKLTDDEKRALRSHRDDLLTIICSKGIPHV